MKWNLFSIFFCDQILIIMITPFISLAMFWYHITFTKLPLAVHRAALFSIQEDEYKQKVKK